MLALRGPPESPAHTLTKSNACLSISPPSSFLVTICRTSFLSFVARLTAVFSSFPGPSKTPSECSRPDPTPFVRSQRSKINLRCLQIERHVDMRPSLKRDMFQGKALPASADRRPQTADRNRLKMEIGSFG